MTDGTWQNGPYPPGHASGKVYVMLVFYGHKRGFLLTVTRDFLFLHFAAGVEHGLITSSQQPDYTKKCDLIQKDSV